MAIGVTQPLRLSLIFHLMGTAAVGLNQPLVHMNAAVNFAGDFAQNEWQRMSKWSGRFLSFVGSAVTSTLLCTAGSARNLNWFRVHCREDIGLASARRAFGLVQSYFITSLPHSTLATDRRHGSPHAFINQARINKECSFKPGLQSRCLTEEETFFQPATSDDNFPAHYQSFTPTLQCFKYNAN
ncbi:hypothetical protein AVEN_214085-1 [Araneus ventricosus]|uniref:Uncharacterized protein n=1 Tax=Araneus ventricosus TaxID=182803 RepID=A0A4Y2NTP6_ARAVE|nr:hypothetical protein AVEN_214085-1 [Araneus ventricosus]